MLAPDGFEPYWKEGLPAEEYHADLASVSSSALRRILKSPRTFKALRDKPEKPTDAMAFGTLVHGFVLEGPEYLKRYVVMPNFTKTHGHPNSNIHKAAKGEWLLENAGRLIVEQDELDDIHGMLEAIIEHEDAFALLKNGVTEISGYYRDPETGIFCRIRPDFLGIDTSVIVDLKTTTSVEEVPFSNAIWKFRFDFQISMYGEGAQIISGKKLDHHAFIAVEKERPYEVAVYHADPAMLEKGSSDYHAALRKLKGCLDTNKWPGYQKGIQNIGLPLRALTDY